MISNRMEWADAYGEQTESLYLSIQDLLSPESEAFAKGFFREMIRSESGSSIIDRLSPQQFTELWRAQAQHFRMLISPKLTCLSHFDAAQKMGRTYAWMGIELDSMVRAQGAYQRSLQDRLEAHQAPPSLIWSINRRLTLDLQGKTHAFRNIDEERLEALAEIDRLASRADSLTDLLSNTLLALSSVTGLIGGFFSRPDAKGRMQIEAVGPGAIHDYAEAISCGEIPPFSISAAEEAGRGPAGRAWRSGQVTRVDNFNSDSTTNPWKATAARLGIQCAVAIPLLDEAGQSRAMLTLYACTPGFFSSIRQQAFAEHLQQVLSLAVLRFQRRRAVPYTERQTYRTLLRDRSVEMLYQPIIDLKTGKLRKVEALARLRGTNGALIPPSRFLPAFGNVDLLHLFEQGLEQACVAHEQWHALGISVELAINFPPRGIVDSRYHDVLFGVIRAGGLEPTQLHLEILENEESVGSAPLDQFLAQLRDMGIRLAQDDLGSGYSTLLRMDGFPFDEIKIDQEFVRGGVSRPVRGLEFIRHLTRLGHDVGMSVTVEGLESEGLVEAAAILGAESGQGYSIALPMAPSELHAWQTNFHLSIDLHQPRTPLGALAGYLLWDRQLENLGRWPTLIGKFVSSPCAVSAFIATKSLSHSRLGELLENAHRHALQGHDDPRYVRAKRELLTYLSERV